MELDTEVYPDLEKYLLWEPFFCRYDWMQMQSSYDAENVSLLAKIALDVSYYKSIFVFTVVSYSRTNVSKKVFIKEMVWLDL